MSWTNTAEYVFYASYPSGRTDRRLIDDFTRLIKEGFRARLDQEHHWPKPDDTGYVDGAGGKHRPSSARAYVVQVQSTGYPDFLPTLTDAEDNILYSIYTGKAGTPVAGDSEDSPDDFSEQWKGTAWVRDGSYLRPLITRIRGKFRFNGMVHFMPEIRSWQGQSVGGLTLDEANVTRPMGTASASWNTDGMALYPFYRHSATLHGTTSNAHETLLYPIRVGKIAPADHTFTELSSTEPPTEAVGFYIGNYPNGNGAMYALTKRGIEIYTSGTVRGNDILIDGISLRKHNHGGGSMGAPIDPTAMGGVVYFASKELTSGETTLSTTGWTRLIRYVRDDVIPRPRPIEPLSGAEAQANNLDFSKLVIRYHIYVTFKMDASTNASVLHLGLGQTHDTGGGNPVVIIRGAQTVPLLVGGLMDHHASFEVVYTPDIGIDPDRDLELFAKKLSGGDTVKFVSVEALLTVMAWNEAGS